MKDVREPGLVDIPLERAGILSGELAHLTGGHVQSSRCLNNKASKNGALPATGLPYHNQWPVNSCLQGRRDTHEEVASPKPGRQIRPRTPEGFVGRSVLRHGVSMPHHPQLRRT
jgi:hypothetical protein